MRPIFFIGNKRSGTQRLVTLLCLHQEVFVSLESDIMWILYQARNGKPEHFERYKWGESVGMKLTLNLCGEILNELYNGQITIQEAFYKVQTWYMSNYRENNHYNWWSNDYKETQYIGDKKPVSCSDPIINTFIEENFHNARYIHLVRNPRGAVPSMMIAAQTWPAINAITPFWTLDAQSILERWTIHEEWALDIERKNQERVYRLRLCDLCAAPIETMRGLFDWLGLDICNEMANTIKSWVDPNPNDKHKNFDLQLSDRAKRIMDIYGYDYA